MTIRRPIAEVVRALAVLALIFLNFAHAPMVVSAQLDASWSATALESLCGDLPTDQGQGEDHAPCHACRIGSGADLPVAFAQPLVWRAVATVRYAASMLAPGGEIAFAWPAARAPPRLA